MTLLLATSCLQGRPLKSAITELIALGVDGVQLCPGNAPDFVSRAWMEASSLVFRTHHGFAWDAMRQPVWTKEGYCCVDSDSVHPPKDTAEWMVDPARCYEVMYPGYRLGDGRDVHVAMSYGLFLAVDVSHVFIQLQTGAIDVATWRALQDYEHVSEVHVSANDGLHDSHRPLTAASFGLDWARERMTAGVPLVLESYMHRLNDGERRRQIEIARGE